MTGHEYLLKVIEKQKMPDRDLETLRKLRQEIEGVLKREYSRNNPRFYYGGSYGKKTMIRESYDLDIVIYFPFQPNYTLQTIYESVHQTLLKSGYRVNPKTVSLQLLYENGFHIDVVPGRAQDTTYQYATLYKNRKSSTMQTSLKVHIDSVRPYRDIIKLMKLWRIRRSLEWKTFAIEQTVIRALRYKPTDDYTRCLFSIFQFIQDNFSQIRLVDPANDSNIIEMSEATRNAVKQAAINSLKAQYWNDVIW
jgi:hypothetical protein